MRHLAIIIPEKIPSSVSKGVQRVLSGLHCLPDDYLIYYEPLINPNRPDFIIIGPNLGLLVIEIRNWYPGQISSLSETEIIIRNKSSGTEPNPLFHATQFLESIIHRAAKYPLCSSVVSKDNGPRGFRFPSGSLLILPNCTSSQLKNHPLGDLYTIFDPEHTVCREGLKEMEKWDMVDLIPFLRSCTYPHGRHIPLTCEQIHIIRAIIHPGIVIEVPELTDSGENINGPLTSLKILDSSQENTLLQLIHGHHIFYGPEGSGKSAILIARARILHNRSSDHHALFLCVSPLRCTQLQKSFSGYPRVEVISFEKWAEKLGIKRRKDNDGEYTDQELGIRLYEKLLDRREEFLTYDAVYIDEGNEFPSSWFQCAREALKNPDHGDLLIVIDGLKSVQGPDDTRWKKLGIHSQGHISRLGLRLEKQFRNTREIINLARLFLLPAVEDDDELYKSLVLACDCSIRTGLRPLLVWNTSHENQAEYAVYLVQRLLVSLKSAQHLSGLTPDDIAILYPYAEGQDRNIICDMIANLGRFFPVQWVSEDLTTYKRLNLPGVKVHDCHSIKGTYYRVVMILFAENFERFFKDSEFFSDRNLFYTALTRPLDFLTIQYTDRTEIIRKILASGYVDEFTGK